MKYLLVILISYCALNLVKSQSCETSLTLFKYNDKNIAKSGSNVTITFNVYSSLVPVDCYNIYIWDFGDGTSFSKTIYPNETYTIETHSYNLNNTAIVSNGCLQVWPTLKILKYIDYTSGNCQQNSCYSSGDYISYLIPTSGYNISLKPDPVYTDYPINKPISLYFTINASSYLQTNDLSYVFDVDGNVKQNGTIQTTDLNKSDVFFYSYTPTAASSQLLTFNLKQYGNIVGTKGLSINVVGSGGGSNIPAGSCLCNPNLKPKMNITYSIEKENITLKVNDTSSTEYRKVFSGSAYLINYYRGNEFKYSIKGTFNQTNGYNHIFNSTIPDVFEPPIMFYFQFQQACYLSNGDQSINAVSKWVTIQPRNFNPNENAVSVKNTGGYVSIKTHTELCNAVEISSKNIDDELDWINNLNVGSYISFDADTNFENYTRDIDIKLFVDGNYDKCADVVNGEITNYRTIKVTQPSLLNTINPNENNIIFNNNRFPGNTKYVAFVSFNGTAITSTKLYQYPGIIPLGILYNTNGLKIKCFDENKNLIGEYNYSIGKFICTDSPTNASINQLLVNKDIVIVNNNQILNTGSVSVPANKALILYSPTEINLTEGFEIEVGANFEGSIKPCSVLKNMPENIIISDSVKLVEVKSHIEVYPNPSSSFFNIESRVLGELIESIEILDLQGTTIKIFLPYTQLFGFELQDFARGIYLAKIKTKNSTIIKKIIYE